MIIDADLLRFIQNRLSVKIIKTSPVSGGSINCAYCVETTTGKYFIKVNNKNSYPGMFEAEAKGLALIAATNTIKVPGTIFYGDWGDECLLVLEWIDTRQPTTKAAEELGRQLAMMHQCTDSSFGLAYDNYMGSLHQSNKKHKSWTSFFVEERLMPMVKMACEKNQLNHADLLNFEKLYKNLQGLFDEEPPSLIHGDLWGGNYLVDLNETPYLIDPAVSYGHREFDIAMTTLFGGFADEFYVAYDEAFPSAKGWRQRIDLWNLYPLLVHLNLFGAGYLGQVRGCLKQYV